MVSIDPVQVRTPAAAPRGAVRIADYSVILLSVVLSVGSILWFAWSNRPVLVRLHLSVYGALTWNALMSSLFFLQHSVLVRRSIRNRLAAVIPDRYDLAFYAITSGIVLAVVTILLQRVEAPPIWVLDGVPRLIVLLAAVCGLALIGWSVVALRTFDPCGLRPIRAHLRGDPADPQSPLRAKAKEFTSEGPFRWVRHPLYLAFIALFWATPHMTVARLEIAVLWTSWILVATLLEERDLTRDLGDRYRQYCEKVPMLIPWRRPAPDRL